VQGKLARPVREETDGKGPDQRHLASGRLHSAGGCAEKDLPCRHLAARPTHPRPAKTKPDSITTGPPLHPWYRHITLAMLAAAYLAVTRDQEEKKGDTHPPTS
jgi:hypothetical protein